MPASLELIAFHSHGSRLLGYFFGPDATGPFPTVLLLHGIPGVEKNWDLAYALRGAGWAVLLMHYRGCWGSDGNYSLPGIVDDIIAGIDYLSERSDVDLTRLAGVGLSLGGWGVVVTAARDERLRAIVAINPLVTPKAQPLDDDTFREFAGPLTGITPEEVKAQWLALTPLTEVAHRLTRETAQRPILLLTGDADELFDVEHERPLAGALPFARFAWKRIPGARHMFSDHRTVLVRTVINWLTHVFSPIPPYLHTFTFRPPTESDHQRVLAVLVDWWNGRDLSHLLPRLYFQHFNDTSFIVEKDGELAAFLIGFLSQSEARVAYIHFVGVHPEHRKVGLGRALYERFFELARARGAREVHCITGPANTGSIAFHTRLGFTPSAPIADYDGPGDDRVTFKKMLDG